MILKVFILLSILININNCAKILGVFFVPSISHQIVYQTVWKQLSLRHEVTILSPNILNDTTYTNLTEIDLSFSYELVKQKPFHEVMPKDNFMFQNIISLFNFLQQIICEQLEHKPVIDLIKDNKKHFDLILVESLNPLVYAFGKRFNAPVVGISSLGVFLNYHDAVGNPTHPVISPDILLNLVGKPTFYDRLTTSLYNIWYRVLYYGYLLPKADTVARKYFGNDMPYLGDLERNVSLLLLNVNPILHPIRPNVPSIIELGQMHIQPKKPLPKDLQEFLDKSTEGVVYFSLGSNVKSANLTENIRNVIVQALSELPYKVLWKWESDYLPNQPKNVITRKWLPQQDVLGHPNIKVFVSQGGLQSLEESISNGVPLVGIPFFADQPLNVMKMEELGIAKRIDFAQMTKEDLKSVILEVATNKKYRDNVVRVKNLLQDQPMTGLEKAVWWIEYVIRHKGAAHLRSPAADMSWYDYLLLDVIGFVIGVLLISVYLCYKIIGYLFITENKKHKIKTQ